MKLQEYCSSVEPRFKLVSRGMTDKRQRAKSGRYWFHRCSRPTFEPGALPFMGSPTSRQRCPDLNIAGDPRAIGAQGISPAQRAGLEAEHRALTGRGESSRPLRAGLLLTRLSRRVAPG